MKNIIEIYEKRFGKVMESKKTSWREFGRKAALGAWQGGPHKVEVMAGDKKIVFEGTVVEVSYEEFSADYNVYLQEGGERKVLFTIDSRSVAPYKKELVTKGDLENVANLWRQIQLEEEYIFVKEFS